MISGSDRENPLALTHNDKMIVICFYVMSLLDCCGDDRVQIGCYGYLPLTLVWLSWRLGEE